MFTLSTRRYRTAAHARPVRVFWLKLHWRRTVARAWTWTVPV